MDTHRRTPIHVVVVLAARADRAAAATWCDRVRTLLRESPGAVVDCDVERLSGSAAEVIDALARLRLVARRAGGQLRLQRADPALRTLLDLLGFADLLPCDPRYVERHSPTRDEFRPPPRSQ
ncbi:STAS domain-containing protein [Actinomycetes bacterium KLBMP 9797]